MLDIQSVTVGYGTIPVLREVSIQVKPGQLVAVVGPNGAGKSTLIRDLLREAGDRVMWHEPEAMPRRWLEAVHDPEYVAEVLEAREQHPRGPRVAHRGKLEGRGAKPLARVGCCAVGRRRPSRHWG